MSDLTKSCKFLSDLTRFWKFLSDLTRCWHKISATNLCAQEAWVANNFSAECKILLKNTDWLFLSPMHSLVSNATNGSSVDPKPTPYNRTTWRQYMASTTIFRPCFIHITWQRKNNLWAACVLFSLFSPLCFGLNKRDNSSTAKEEIVWQCLKKKFQLLREAVWNSFKQDQH